MEMFNLFSSIPLAYSGKIVFMSMRYARSGVQENYPRAISFGYAGDYSKRSSHTSQDSIMMNFSPRQYKLFQKNSPNKSSQVTQVKSRKV